METKIKALGLQVSSTVVHSNGLGKGKRQKDKHKIKINDNKKKIKNKNIYSWVVGSGENL